MGIYPDRVKVLAFTVSGAIAALAGALYAHFIGFIDPGSFRSDESITVLCMVVLGGMDNLPGSVLAAYLLTVIPEFLRGFDNVRMLIYGALLVALMLLKTTGRKHDALKLSNLIKSFGGLRAVDGVSFEAHAGALTCITGPTQRRRQTTVFNLLTPDSTLPTPDAYCWTITT